MPQKQTNIISQYLLGLAVGLAYSSVAFALEYRSIVPAKAVLYDAPSVEASKLYILGQGYPVEVIVILGEWIKIRDAAGSLSWIEGKQLSEKRTVLVMVKTDIKSTDDTSPSLVATVEKDVVLELLSISNKTGWVKVKHRDGVIGFLPRSVLWGLN